MPRWGFCAVAFLMDFWWDTVFCLHSRVSYPCLAIFPIEVSQQCEKQGRKYRENQRGVERESLHRRRFMLAQPIVASVIAMIYAPSVWHGLGRSCFRRLQCARYKISPVLPFTVF